jgi:hypothetical protein
MGLETPAQAVNTLKPLVWEPEGKAPKFSHNGSPELKGVAYEKALLEPCGKACVWKCGKREWSAPDYTEDCDLSR